MSNEKLTRLMQEVEHKHDNLLSMHANSQSIIEKLQIENKQLKDNYVKILDQINIYVNELEKIKKLQK